MPGKGIGHLETVRRLSRAPRSAPTGVEYLGSAWPPRRRFSAPVCITGRAPAKPCCVGPQHVFIVRRHSAARRRFLSAAKHRQGFEWCARGLAETFHSGVLIERLRPCPPQVEILLLTTEVIALHGDEILRRLRCAHPDQGRVAGRDVMAVSLPRRRAGKRNEPAENRHIRDFRWLLYLVTGAALKAKTPWPSTWRLDREPTLSECRQPAGQCSPSAMCRHALLSAAPSAVGEAPWRSPTSIAI